MRFLVACPIAPRQSPKQLSPLKKTKQKTLKSASSGHRIYVQRSSSFILPNTSPQKDNSSLQNISTKSIFFILWFTYHGCFATSFFVFLKSRSYNLFILDIITSTPRTDKNPICKNAPQYCGTNYATVTSRIFLTIPSQRLIKNIF